MWIIDRVRAALGAVWKRVRAPEEAPGKAPLQRHWSDQFHRAYSAYASNVARRRRRLAAVTSTDLVALLDESGAALTDESGLELEAYS